MEKKKATVRHFLCNGLAELGISYRGYDGSHWPSPDDMWTYNTVHCHLWEY